MSGWPAPGEDAGLVVDRLHQAVRLLGRGGGRQRAQGASRRGRGQEHVGPLLTLAQLVGSNLLGEAQPEEGVAVLRVDLVGPLERLDRPGGVAAEAPALALLDEVLGRRGVPLLGRLAVLRVLGAAGRESGGEGQLVGGAGAVASALSSTAGPAVGRRCSRARRGTAPRLRSVGDTWRSPRGRIGRPGRPRAGPRGGGPLPDMLSSPDPPCGIQWHSRVGRGGIGAGPIAPAGIRTGRRAGVALTCIVPGTPDGVPDPSGADHETPPQIVPARPGDPSPWHSRPDRPRGRSRRESPSPSMPPRSAGR